MGSSFAAGFRSSMELSVLECAKSAMPASLSLSLASLLLLVRAAAAVVPKITTPSSSSSSSSSLLSSSLSSSSSSSSSPQEPFHVQTQEGGATAILCDFAKGLVQVSSQRTTAVAGEGGAILLSPLISLFRHARVALGVGTSESPYPPSSIFRGFTKSLGGVSRVCASKEAFFLRVDNWVGARGCCLRHGAGGASAPSVRSGAGGASAPFVGPAAPGGGGLAPSVGAPPLFFRGGILLVKYDGWLVSK